jgi:hypothetical protein
VHLARYEKDLVYGTRVTVSGPALSQDLTIYSDPVSAGRVAGLEILTGDALFDGAVSVQGPPALAHALLDAETRRVLTGLLSGQLRQSGRPTFWASGSLDHGVLRIDIPEVTPKTQAGPLWLDSEVQGVPLDSGRDAVAGLERFPEALERVLFLARRLETPAAVPQRIAANLATEPDPGVRLRLLATLTREAPDLPLTQEALLVARDDPDAQVRLHAGTALGDEGTEVLVHLADGEGADDATTQKAVAALGDRLSPEKAVSILRGALRTRRTATALACIPLLGARRGTAGARLLQSVLAVEEPRLAAAAASALGEIVDLDPALALGRERALTEALDHRSREVRIAAAHALGRTGTVAVIGRLKQAETDDSALRAPARQAIATIQSRLPGAAAGQLSLAGGEAGRLSLAGAEGGQVSLADSDDSEARSLAAGGAAHRAAAAAVSGHRD